MSPPRIVRTCAVVVGLFSLGLAASAAPTKLPAKKVTATGLPKATTTTCKSPPPESDDECLAKGYLDGACGKKYGKTHCKKRVQNELTKLYDANPGPVVKMLEPNKSEIPRDLRTGKVFEYEGPKAKAQLLGTFAKIQTIPAKAKAVSKPTLEPVAKVARGAPLTGDAMSSLGSARPQYDLAKQSVSKLGVKALTSDNIFARTGLTRPPFSGSGSGLPITAHRNPAWEANGQKIASCEEYAYEKVYDWARYTDAVAACSGDLLCQLDIAFLKTTPGIAGRTLKRKDGAPLSTQIAYDKVKKLPKNDMFAVGARFAYAGGPEGVAKSPAVDALVDALKAGETYYQLGCSGACGKNQFADEWDFHRELYDANRTVSIAEHEEYEARKARFRELVSQWNRAVGREKDAMLDKIPKLKQQWVSPIDMVTHDPIERLDMMRSMASKARFSGQKLRKKLGPAKLKAMPGAGVANTPVVGGTAVLGGAKAGAAILPPLDGDAPSAAGLLAMAPKAKATTPKKGPLTPTAGTASKAGAGSKGASPASGAGGNPGSTPAGSDITPADATASMCDPKKFAKVIEMLGHGPLTCQIGQFLRDEWNRKLAGHRSCLDLDNNDCDWSPMMFEARFTEGVPYLDEQNEYEAECTDFTGDNFTTPMANIAATEAYIAEMKTQIGNALDELRPYAQADNKHGRVFGRGWTDADHFGDKDWFAAGYDYDLGWDVTPVKSEQGGNICELGGGARGGFGVDGWFIKNQFEVVDGLARGDYNRKADKKGDIDIHLRVFGKNMFDPVDVSFTGAWEHPLAQGDIQIPTGYKPSFNFMAGPVPITGAVWGEFFYGAKFGVNLVSEADCNMTDIKLGAKARFTPELGLNAKAQVGVGISGLLSAGIRGMVNLVTVGVPVDVGLSTKIKDVSNQLQTMLGFDLDVRLALSTLSGWIAVYVEVLMIEEEFVIFRWNGLGPEEISLLGEPLKVELPVFAMAKK